MLLSKGNDISHSQNLISCIPARKGDGITSRQTSIVSNSSSSKAYSRKSRSLQLTSPRKVQNKPAEFGLPSCYPSKVPRGGLKIKGSSDCTKLCLPVTTIIGLSPAALLRSGPPFCVRAKLAPLHLHRYDLKLPSSPSGQSGCRCSPRETTPKGSSPTAAKAAASTLLVPAVYLSPDTGNDIDELSKEAVQTSRQGQARTNRRRHRFKGLGALNILAALYGTSAVASKFVDDEARAVPASLTSFVRFASAAVVFGPALVKAMARKDLSMLKAGLELGLWNFMGAVALAIGPSGSTDSNASLLFAFTVFFVPVMELCYGKAVSRSTWMATIAALAGMGLLEEENQNWKGVPIPQLSDLRSVLGPAMSAIHIFRSEALGTRFDPLELTAVQVAVLAILGLGWEAWSFQSSGDGFGVLCDQLRSLPWVPLLYGGFAYSGLCSWLELRCLRDVHASTATLVYTTIPIWGAFFSFLLRGETPGPSAMIFAAVILCTSLSAQAATLAEDLEKTKRQRQERALQIKNRTVTGEVDTFADMDSSASDPSLDPSNAAEKSSPAGVSQINTALLTSQLKFPFYAAQVQHLMTEAKLKLGTFKATLLSIGASLPSGNGQGQPGSAGATSTLASTAASGAAATTAAASSPGLSMTAATSAVTSAATSAAVSSGPTQAALTASVPNSGVDMVASHAASAAGVMPSSASHTILDVISMSCGSLSGVLPATMAVLETIDQAKGAGTTLLATYMGDTAAELVSGIQGSTAFVGSTVEAAAEVTAVAVELTIESTAAAVETIGSSVLEAAVADLEDMGATMSHAAESGAKAKSAMDAVWSAAMDAIVNQKAFHVVADAVFFSLHLVQSTTFSTSIPPVGVLLYAAPVMGFAVTGHHIATF